MKKILAALILFFSINAYAGGWCPTDFRYTLLNNQITLNWGNCDTSHEYHLEVDYGNGFTSQRITLDSANPRSYTFKPKVKSPKKIKVRLRVKRKNKPFSDCTTDILQISY